MTAEEKEKLIARMLDTPEFLSDKELREILQDEELRDIYNMSAELTGVCSRPPEPDMKAEWELFRPRIRRKPDSMRWIMRVASIFLGVMFISGIIGRIIDYTLTSSEPAKIALMKESREKTEKTSATRLETQPATSGSEVKNEQTAKTARSVKTADKKSEQSSIASGAIIDQKEESFDIDEYLRIQQASIDNELALQAAESYQEEYERMASILNAAGISDEELDITIKKVTME